MQKRFNIKKYTGLFLFLFVTFSAAYIGATASISAKTFYAELTRPLWAPPGYLFGPVWSVLYIMMAVSAWLVWIKENYSFRRVSVLTFFFQLALNALWTWIFFVWNSGFFAFIEILILWILILLTIYLFNKRSKIAAALLIPYLLWVTFASALTFAIWQSNPEIL